MISAILSDEECRSLKRRNDLVKPGPSATPVDPLMSFKVDTPLEIFSITSLVGISTVIMIFIGKSTKDLSGFSVFGNLFGLLGQGVGC
jgi:hypothetical protein